MGVVYKVGIIKYLVSGLCKRDMDSRGEEVRRR
jgi:hypothetical protein